jgi:DNA adenine methylase
MRTIPQLEPLFPPHRHHVIPFGGMLGELLGKSKPSYLETVNDINRMTVNYYLTLKYDVEGLIARLVDDPYSQAFFQAAKQLLASGRGDSLDLAEAYALVANQSRGNADPTCKSLQWSLAYTSNKTTYRWQHIAPILRAVSGRLRRVQILDGWPWERVLEMFDSPETLFTCDPPFLPETLRSQTPMYRHRMTASDHERLLITLDGLKASWMLLGYDSKLYRHYVGQPDIRLDQPVCISAATEKPRCEKCIWIRY